MTGVYDELVAGTPYDPSALGLAGNPYDPSFFHSALAGDAPGVSHIEVPGLQVAFDGSVFIATPGERGPKGEDGLPGLPGPLGLFAFQTDVFYVVAPGSQTLHLSKTPQSGSISLYVNGAFQTDISDLQISGAVISIPGSSWPLVSPDVLAVQYGYLP